MNDINETTTSDTDATVLDLDDVEGHGLREVAAGLGAAAVLAGGGSAALASQGIHLSPVHPSGPAISTGVISDPVGTTDKLVDQGLNDARSARDGALTTVNGEVTQAGTLANGTVAQAEGVAANTVAYVNQDVAAAKTIAGNATSWAGTTAGSTATGAVKTVNNTVASTVDVKGAVTYANDTANSAGHTATTTVAGAQTTASSTVADAGRKAATVLNAAATAVQDGVTTVTTTIKSAQLGAGTDMGSQSTWMTASIDGVVVAQWESHGTTSTVSIKTPAGATSITISMLGNDVLNGAETTISL